MINEVKYSRIEEPVLKLDVSTKKPHHVPECYLRYFCFAKNRVFAYSRKGPPFARNISEICVRRGLHDDETERILHNIETQAGVVLKKLVRGPASPLTILDDSDRVVLSTFIGYMSSRNPYTLDELQRLHDIHYDLLMKLTSTRPDLLNDYLRDSGLKIDADTVKKFFSAVSEDELKRLVREAVHEEWLPKLIEYGDKTASLLIEQTSWIIAQPQSGRFLITSDSPAVIADLERTPGSEGVVENGIVHFPISPNKTILISGSDLGLDHRGLTNRQTRNLNDFEMHFAYRWVYSDRDEAFIDNHFKSTRDGALLGIARETSKIYETQDYYSKCL